MSSSKTLLFLLGLTLLLLLSIGLDSSSASPWNSNGKTLYPIKNKDKNNNLKDVDPLYPLDCAIRKAGYDYANKLQPQRAPNVDVFDGFQLGSYCNFTRPTYVKPPRRAPMLPRLVELYKKSSLSSSSSSESQDENYKAAPDYFVSTTGNDTTGSGSISNPFQTIQKAILACRNHLTPVDPCFVTIRGGTYYVKSTIKLFPTDSGLTIRAYPEEKVILSGAVPVSGLNWTFLRDSMSYQIGADNVFDDVNPGQSIPGKILYLGFYNTYQECAAHLDTNDTYTSFIWHSPNFSNPAYQKQCYVRLDGLWAPGSPISEIVSGRQGASIYYTTLPASAPQDFTSLFFSNGNRAYRARFPNNDPEMFNDAYQYGFTYVADWLWEPLPAGTLVDIDYPNRPGSTILGMSRNHQQLNGGPANRFVPPVMPSCSRARFAANLDADWTSPQGMLVDPTAFPINNWKTPTTGVVHSFQAEFWGNWQWEIGNVTFDKATNLTRVTFGKGGYQMGQGSNYGGATFVENIEEELDWPGEWFYNPKTRTLSIGVNRTDTPDSTILIPVLESIFTIEGTLENPVRNITFDGLTFTQTITTYLSDYEIPSGGDWGVHRRGAAIFAEGTEFLTITGCTFSKLGSNGLTISKYSRNATVYDSEFYSMGESGILSIGHTEMADATEGNFPMYNTITDNIFHEMGIYGKQTAFYFQAKTAKTLIQNNVAFNGPRSGINFNDGLGGGSLVANNCLFNFVRETGDHGPFNSWDREPYLTTVAGGEPTVDSLLNNITRNFIYSNYHSTWPIDHDDGSQGYLDTYNFLVYGGYKNYLGHDKQSSNNIYIHPEYAGSDTEKAMLSHVRRSRIGAEFKQPHCASSAGQLYADSGYNEYFLNNTCVIDGTEFVFSYDGCNPVDLNNPPNIYSENNTYYVGDNNQATMECGGGNVPFELYISLSGADRNSVIHKSYPTISQIIGWAYDMLGFIGDD